MKKYFYADGTNRFGPFSLTELKEKGITRETDIWFNELGKWEKAGTITELQDLFTMMPPPIIKPTTKVPGTKKGKAIDIFVLLSLAYWVLYRLIYFLGTEITDFLYSGPFNRYFEIGLDFIFAILPIAFALSVKNKTLKIIAIILSTLISINILRFVIKALIYY